MSELHNNALERGLLGLESSLKDVPEGLMYYFDERERRLKTLDDGEIAILIDNVARPDRAGGCVTDSGVGIDTASVAGFGSIEALHGLGPQLVESPATRPYVSMPQAMRRKLCTPGANAWF